MSKNGDIRFGMLILEPQSHRPTRKSNFPTTVCRLCQWTISCFITLGAPWRCDEIALRLVATEPLFMSREFIMLVGALAMISQ